jgi:hypothetical protein
MQIGPNNVKCENIKFLAANFYLCWESIIIDLTVDSLGFSDPSQVPYEPMKVCKYFQKT